MFTGIIQQKAILKARKVSGNAGKLTIQLERPLEKPQMGESIAVNGACLTLENVDGNLCTFHVLAETFHKTNLGKRPVGSILNVERALCVGDSIGGHIVTGHVDGTGKLLELKECAGDFQLKVSVPPQISPYLVPKGSIAVDGVSLTIAALDADSVTVCLIPTTLMHTDLKNYKAGDDINLEADILAKQVSLQVQRIMTQGEGKPETARQLSLDDLFKAGF